MDETSTFEIAHPAGDLRGHVHEHDGGDVLAVAVAQVVQQVTLAHELGDDVEGGLARAHAQQLHEVRVLHLLHDGRLLQEVLQCHGVLFESLDSNLELLVRNVSISLI